MEAVYVMTIDTLVDVGLKVEVLTVVKDKVLGRLPSHIVVVPTLIVKVPTFPKSLTGDILNTSEYSDDVLKPVSVVVMVPVFCHILIYPTYLLPDGGVGTEDHDDDANPDA